MNCVICESGETEDGRVTVTLERDAITLVIKGVPARVCANCGEEYVEEEIGSRLLKLMDEAAETGILMDVRQYIAA